MKVILMAFLRDNRKIKIRVFMEVMGWPADKLTEHLKTVLKILKEKSMWKVFSEVYAEPEKANEKLYNTHVEFEAEAPDLTSLFLFSMTYGPSVIEIIEPSEVYMTAGEMQDILSDVISKVQSMDKDIKMLALQNKQMTNILHELEKKGIIKKQAPNEETSHK
jgi:hypothetical protein